MNESNAITLGVTVILCAIIASLSNGCNKHYAVETLREQTIQKAFDAGYNRVVTPDYPKATIWTKPPCPVCKERETLTQPVEADEAE